MTSVHTLQGYWGATLLSRRISGGHTSCGVVRIGSGDRCGWWTTLGGDTGIRLWGACWWSGGADSCGQLISGTATQTLQLTILLFHVLLGTLINDASNFLAFCLEHQANVVQLRAQHLVRVRRALLQLPVETLALATWFPMR